MITWVDTTGYEFQFNSHEVITSLKVGEFESHMLSYIIIYGQPFLEII